MTDSLSLFERTTPNWLSRLHTHVEGGLVMCVCVYVRVTARTLVTPKQLTVEAYQCALELWRVSLSRSLFRALFLSNFSRRSKMAAFVYK